jgi:hypothetical protein
VEDRKRREGIVTSRRHLCMFLGGVRVRLSLCIEHV